MARRLVVKLTDGERRALLTAAFYYANDADPTREGDLASVSKATWDALDRAMAKLDTERADAND